MTVEVPVRGVSAPEALALVVNGENTARLDAKATPEDATGVTFAYASSDESVATVDANGRVKAVKVGTATITAAAGQARAEYALTVRDVSCSYCGQTGHTSASCPTKAADEQAAAQAAAQQAAQQAAQDAAGSSDSPAPEPQPGGSAAFGQGQGGSLGGTVVIGGGNGVGQDCP